MSVPKRSLLTGVAVAALLGPVGSAVLAAPVAGAANTPINGSLTVTHTVTKGSTPLNLSNVQFNQIATYTGTPSEGQITGTVTSGSFYTDGSYLTVYPPTGLAGCVNKWTPGPGSSFEPG
jgi:hypothetical protein